MSGLHGPCGAGERLELPLGPARHDDHGAGGAVDEPPRHAAEEHAAERAVAARAADEQVDVMAELLERRHRAVDQHLLVRRHGWEYATERAPQAQPGPRAELVEVCVDVIRMYQAGGAPGDGFDRRRGVELGATGSGER